MLTLDEVRKPNSATPPAVAERAKVGALGMGVGLLLLTLGSHKLHKCAGEGKVHTGVGMNQTGVGGDQTGIGIHGEASL